MAQIVDIAAARRARDEEALKGYEGFWHVCWLEMPPWLDARDPAFDSDAERLERLATVIPFTLPSAPDAR